MLPTPRGPWSADDAADFLTGTALPIRMACIGRDGFPRVISLWYRYEPGVLQCVSHRESALVKLLRKDARVGFEVSPNDPPYHGLRGQGEVGLKALGDSDVLEALITRYLGDEPSRVGQWLLSRKEEEMLLTLRPQRLFSWDYRERMSDVARDTTTRSVLETE